jgi:hypothetical protein
VPRRDFVRAPDRLCLPLSYPRLPLSYPRLPLSYPPLPKGSLRQRCAKVTQTSRVAPGVHPLWPEGIWRFSGRNGRVKGRKGPA